jgi:hypothetical protein
MLKSFSTPVSAVPVLVYFLFNSKNFSCASIADFFKLYQCCFRFPLIEATNYRPYAKAPFENK